MQKISRSTWRIVSILISAFVLFAPHGTRAAFPEDGKNFDFSEITEAVAIGSFHADIDVHADRSIRVKETIHAVFQEERHGIFRDIPAIYEDAGGNRINAHFALEEVLLNGKSVPYEQSWIDGTVHIKIGDPDVYLDGVQVYTLTYTMEDVILFFDTYDEFYWNITGTDWEMNIYDATAEFHFPEGTKVMQDTCYTGVYGSNAQDCEIVADGSVVRVQGKGYIAAAIGIEKGVILEPTTAQILWKIVRDNWWGLLPLLVLVFTFRHWRKHGRDDRKETVIPEYEPPNKMNAAAVALLHGGVKYKFILTAMVVEMAIGGYLVMDVENRKNGKVKDITLRKQKESEGLDERYAKLFDTVLFKDDRKEISLKSLGKEQSGNKVLRIFGELVTEFRRKLLFNKESLKYQIFFVLLGASMLVLSFMALDFGLFTGFTTLFAGIGVFILGFLMRKKTPEGNQLLRHAQGFYLFIKTAEVHRSEWQQKEGIFEKVLPYAIAFGLAKHWARAFPDLQFEPNWYHGTASFTVNGFASGLTSMSNKMYGGLAATPQSSGSHSSGGGSGGGGFSGGGFGGGGGGSW